MSDREGPVEGRSPSGPARQHPAAGRSPATVEDGDAAVLVTVAGGVGTLTLNRPAVNNAYDGSLLAAIQAGVEGLAADPAARVIVVRGNGRHFQAGADLTWLRTIAAQDPAANLAASRATAQAMRALNEIGKPVLALVQGACIGGGTGLIASCDIVIAESTATFSISEARWGLTASIIFPQLVAAIGLRQVRRYALTCETLDARHAQAIGLVHEVCEPGRLDAAAAPLVAGLLRAAPGAVSVSKASAMRCAEALLPAEAWQALETEHALRRQSTEAAHGLESFGTRRNPPWWPER